VGLSREGELPSGSMAALGHRGPVPAGGQKTGRASSGRRRWGELVSSSPGHKPLQEDLYVPGKRASQAQFVWHAVVEGVKARRLPQKKEGEGHRCKNTNSSGKEN